VSINDEEAEQYSSETTVFLCFEGCLYLETAVFLGGTKKV